MLHVLQIRQHAVIGLDQIADFVPSRRNVQGLVAFSSDSAHAPGQKRQRPGHQPHHRKCDNSPRQQAEPGNHQSPALGFPDAPG
ncbi:hypothetical protein D3C76_1638730 [compost metagenome]